MKYPSVTLMIYLEVRFATLLHNMDLRAGSRPRCRRRPRIVASEISRIRTQEAIRNKSLRGGTARALNH